MYKITIIIIFIFGVYIVNGQDKNISFVIKNAGINVDGHFDKYTAHISYNENNPNDATFTGEIDVKSINTGNKMRDNALQKVDYFDPQTYPNIKFKSKSVQKISKDLLKVSGYLTIKDVTKLIDFEVTIKNSGQKKVYFATLPLNRRNYRVGGKSIILSDDLKIFLKIED